MKSSLAIAVAVATVILVPRSSVAGEGDPAPCCGGRAWLPPAPAPASPRPAPVFDRAHVGVEALAGFATPLGSLGASVFVTPHPLLSFDLGVGVGLTGNLQKAATVRLHPIRGNPGLSFGAGASSGPHDWYHGGWNYPNRKHWTNARWANVEVNLTGRSSGGLQGRLFVGYSRQFNADAGCQVEYLHDDSGFPVNEPPTRCSGSGGTQLLYTGGALRFAAPFGI